MISISNITRKVSTLMGIILCSYLQISCSINNTDSPLREESFYTVDQERISLKNYRGQWIIINFWASWCAPCRQEIPALNTFYAAHQDHDAIVIGVDMDASSIEAGLQHKQDFALQYPATHEDLAKRLKIDVQYLPMTVFINPQGEIVHQAIKAQTLASLEQALQTH